MPMKTKLLLLWLLLLCIPGLKAENIFRLTLTDVPEGLQVKELNLSVRDASEPWVAPSSMSYDESTNSYVLSSNSFWGLEQKTEVTLFIGGPDLIPPTPITWKLTPGKEEQHLEYSFKDFRKYTLSAEPGWTLWEKKDEQTAFLPAIFFTNLSDPGYSLSGAAGSDMTVPINEAEYHVYAQPGTYLWSGALYKSDGSKEIYATEETATFDAESTNVTLTPDWTNKTEVTTRVTGIEEDLSQYNMQFYNTKNELIYAPLKYTVLLNQGENYQWVMSSYNETNFFIAPRSGSFTPEGDQDEIIMDFSDYTKTQINLIEDQPGFTPIRRCLEIVDNISGGVYDAPASLPVYLPKDQIYNLIYFFNMRDTEGQEKPAYPVELSVQTDQNKQIDLRTSDYHKVSFFYENEPIYAQVSLQELPGDRIKSDSIIYMSDGNYHAEARNPNTWQSMTCDFTVNGEDRIIDFKNMADNFRTIFVSIKNADLMPSDIESPYADFTFSRDEYGENFNLSVDLKEGGNSIFLSEGTYTYQVKLESPDNQIVTLPINGTIEVTDNSRELVFDLDTCCIAPLKIKDESGNLLPSFHSTLNYNADLLQKYNTPSYIMLAAASGWRGQLNVYAAGYEAWKKMILINQTPAEINVELKKAEIFPIFIIPEDLKEGETAEIKVEGIGTCYYSHETGFTFIPLSFMQVAAGTYNVTILADGHETVQGQIVVDRSMCAEGSTEIVYRISMENGFTGVQQTDAAETLDIRSEGTQIVIDSETDCRAEIYTLSGVCVAHLKGKKMRSEALAPGIYLVLARNAQGILTRKIIIGN